MAKLGSSEIKKKEVSGNSRGKMVKKGKNRDLAPTAEGPLSGGVSSGGGGAKNDLRKQSEEALLPPPPVLTEGNISLETS